MMTVTKNQNSQAIKRVFRIVTSPRFLAAASMTILALRLARKLLKNKIEDDQ